MKRVVFLLMAGALLFFGSRSLTGLFISGPEVPRGSPQGGGIERIELQGRFDPRAHAVAGQPTVIEFSSDYCPACRDLQRKYEVFLAERPDVAIRQVHLQDDWDPRAMYQDHGVLIRAIPHVIVFGPDGGLLAMDTPNGSEGYEFLLAWIREEAGR
jgi:thiol-disulfide isomerase/thioredoxin